MPTISENDTFPASISYPGDGDDANQASIELFLQDITDRTRYLQNRLIGGPNLFRQPIPLIPLAIGGGGTAWEVVLPSTVSSIGRYALRQANVDSAHAVHIAVPVPPVSDDHAPKIVRCTVAWMGAGHSAVPAVPPEWTLYKQPYAGNEVELANRVSNASVAGSYDAEQTYSVTDLDVALEPLTSYYLKINGEAGANAVADGFYVLGAWIGFQGV